MFKPIQQTAYKVVLGLFMLAFVMVACNNKSEKKTETDTTKMNNMDTTNMSDTSLKMKPTEQGDRTSEPTASQP